jgi:TRAP-type C4-dicarboxylate transport system permease small subunit
MTLRSVEKKMHIISRWAALPGIFILFFMMLFMAIDVGGRYLFNLPIPGSIDFITVMMVFIVFPALAYVSSMDGHVRTDVLFDRFSVRGKGFLDIANSLGSIVFAFLMTYQLGVRIWSDYLHSGNATSYFNWPHLPFMCVAFVGCVLMDLELILWFIRSLGRAVGRIKE